MNDTKKYKFTLNPLSTIILSPREQSCFLCNNKEMKKINGQDGRFSYTDSIKFVYPFYQYGMYEEYEPSNAQYYIPGSSIKGAVGSSLISFDDIRVDGQNISLRNLYKLQNIRTDSAEEKPKLGIFFPKVAIETLDSGTELNGELFTGENPVAVLQDAQQRSTDKLKQLLKQINAILLKYEGESREIKEKDILCLMKSKLETLLREISSTDQRRYLIILGGYKGLNLSGVFPHEAAGAIYIDTENKLPHGLAWIRLE